MPTAVILSKTFGSKRQVDVWLRATRTDQNSLQYPKGSKEPKVCAMSTPSGPKVCTVPCVDLDPLRYITSRVKEINERFPSRKARTTQWKSHALGSVAIWIKA